MAEEVAEPEPVAEPELEPDAAEDKTVAAPLVERAPIALSDMSLCRVRTAHLTLAVGSAIGNDTSGIGGTSTSFVGAVANAVAKVWHCALTSGIGRCAAVL